MPFPTEIPLKQCQNTYFTMKYHFFLFSIFLLISCHQKNQIPSPPNIILFFCDDLGYGDLGNYGHPTIRTPNLDRMAAQGLKFTNFYSGSPACTASRYALLTGRYPIRSGFSWVLVPNSSRGLHPKEVTIAEGLKNAGYATACYGKWHLGNTKKEFLPLQNGFDEYLGLPYSNDMLPPRWGEIPLMEGNDTIEVSPDQSLLTKRYTERAIEFIQKNQESPFFVYLPYAMPHIPLYPGEEFAGKSKRGQYGDVVEEIDWSVGAVWKTVEELGLVENTLLFFTSDNGPWIIKNEKGGSSGLLRDGKGSTWEGGMRVPGIAFWKNKIAEGMICDQPASTLDLYHSFLKLANHHLSENIVDGKDISTWLSGEVRFFPEDKEPYFYYGPKQLHAVRLGAWKLHVRTSSQTRKDYFDGKLPLLFNLEIDPGEQYEISEKHPEIVQELLSEIEKHKQSIIENPDFYKSERSKTQIRHLAFDKKVNFLTPLANKYNNPQALTDGLKETTDYFQYLPGIQENDFEAVIDLENIQKIQSIEAGFIQGLNNWIFLPEFVQFSFSKNGTQWNDLEPLYHEVSLTDNSIVKYFSQTLDQEEVRFIKIFAKNIKTCPTGHPAAGKGAWLFADEVVVK